ncbi:MAG: hypothetical protein AAF556_01520 [Pseudomonadota bacterium]
MRAAFLRSDSLETVTLEAVGAATSASQITTLENDAPKVDPGALAQKIDDVLRREGKSTDPAKMEMAAFLRRIGPDLKSVAAQTPGTEPWGDRLHEMKRNTVGPAEELFKNVFRGQEVPESNPAAHVPSKLEAQFQARAAM